MISFQDISFAYRDRPVLQGVSLTLEPGGFYFLTGPSGSGKTTFLRLCSLEAMPQAGEATFFGESAAGLSRDQIAAMRLRMGMVDQACRFLDHLTVAQNIALPLEISGRRTESHSGDIADLLGWVGLTGHAEALPPTLSGGERQRAALARAVILNPDLLIADEPTGNVDAAMATRILSLMVELNRLGRTILVATHDLDLIRAAKTEVSARILRLNDGQILQAGAEL